MKKVFFLGLILAILLCAAVWASARLWFSYPDVDFGLHGMLALVAGLAASMIIGGGLMALSFYSARSGHDEQAGSPDAGSPGPASSTDSGRTPPSVAQTPRVPEA